MKTEVIEVPLLNVVLVGEIFEPELGTSKTVAPDTKNVPVIVIEDVVPELLSIRVLLIDAILGGVSKILNSLPL